MLRRRTSATAKAVRGQSVDGATLLEAVAQAVAAFDLWAVRLPIGSVARGDPALAREPVFAVALRVFPSRGFVQGESRHGGEQASADQADAQQLASLIRRAEAVQRFAQPPRKAYLCQSRVCRWPAAVG